VYIKTAVITVLHN